ncbi:Palmitoyltransferase [Operophtera brumata]|uniref:Palmitoyltransferase n=1 Tax=Operophtera brumata TaxID=104452 RepID=A0A0L7L4S3_OPEBR|nr:Palmitoyltransferase [Operophtera brumata]
MLFIYPKRGYSRRYPENSNKNDYIVFLNHNKENTAFTDKDRMALSKGLREHGVSGVMHLRSLNKFKVGITFDLPNNANMFLQNKKLLDQLSLRASIPAGDTEVSAVDPARLLLSLGAAPHPRDTAHGNTALHWAILARNATAISTLVLYGEADLEVANLRGVTPLAMLQSSAESLWIGAKISDKIKERTLLQSRRNIFRRLTYDKKLRWWSVVVIPFLAFYLTGIILETAAPYALKALLLAALLLGMCCWMVWGCVRYLSGACGAPAGWPACGAWVAWVCANALFHLFWVSVLTACQLYLVVCLGMTTNEQLNRARYRHFQARGGRSPFSRGPLHNAADFFQCGLCGLLTPRARDWADADERPMLDQFV